MIGYDFGGFISIKVFENISLVPELHFIQKGFKYPIEKTSIWEPNGTGEYYTTKSNANYLSFPINVSWLFYKSAFQSYVFGGVRFDFIVNKNGDYWQYYYDKYKNNDFGYNIGLGLQTKEILGIGTGIEFKYSPNITDSYADGYEQIKNNSFEILLIIYN